MNRTVTSRVNGGAPTTTLGLSSQPSREEAENGLSAFSIVEQFRNPLTTEALAYKGSRCYLWKWTEEGGVAIEELSINEAAEWWRDTNRLIQRSLIEPGPWSPKARAEFLDWVFDETQ